jgi:hypothetical protein
MLILVPFISCILLLSSKVFGGQISSIFRDNVCDPKISAWTSWFNTQDPIINNGNDIEDIAIIRKLYAEASRCESVSNVEYSVSQISNNELGPYQTIINHNGIFCTGSSASRCPNYRVRFCCPLTTNQVSINQCGQTYQSPLQRSSLRIVNGLPAIPHSFPWAVSLQYKGVHDCGGVIVDEWNILTAAHCLDYSNDLGNYFVRVGAHDRYSSGERMPIAQLILHPNYDENRSTNDIGIIRLARPITFSNEIQPICLLDNVCKKKSLLLNQNSLYLDC